jgi:hypothetical protein
MNIEQRSKIYDRLLAIKIKLESVNIPDPRYINQKIGECHSYIEEVEHSSIEVSREISVLEQALNNSTAEYDAKKEGLLLREDIKNLPNIRDREAKSNQYLKEELDRIKTYKNNLSAMLRLEKDLHVKMKNLDRVNKDIKSQLRAMEAQMRIMGGSPGGAVDAASKSLIEEFRKTMTDTDSFEESSTSVMQEQIIDPTAPLDVDNLLSDICEKTIDPTPDISPSEPESESVKLIKYLKNNNNIKHLKNNNVLSESDELIFDSPDVTENVTPTDELDIFAGLVDSAEFHEPDAQANKEVEESLKKDPEPAIDLSDVIDFKQSKGKETSKKAIETEKKVAEPKQKDVRKDQKIGIDIDDLLDSLQP